MHRTSNRAVAYVPSLAKKIQKSYQKELLLWIRSHYLACNIKINSFK